MTDRGWLFICSVLLIVVSLAATGWLVVSGQIHSLDGLFLAHVCLLTALVFALYVWNLIAAAREEIAKELAPKPAAAAAKKAPAAATQQSQQA
jgi:hypothetical protein